MKIGCGCVPRNRHERAVCDGFAYQAVHLHRFCLTKPVTPVFCLAVYLGVEVDIMQNDCVSTCQVQTLSTSSG